MRFREQRRLIRRPGVVGCPQQPTQQRVHPLLQLGDPLLLRDQGLAQLRYHAVQHLDVAGQCRVRNGRWSRRDDGARLRRIRNREVGDGRAHHL
jgi:hypothetical protein